MSALPRIARFTPAAIALLLALAVTVALAKQGVVKTKSGETYEGDVIETADGVVIISRGVQTRIPKAEIESITYGGQTVREQYEERHKKLDAKDVAGRIELASWALEQKEFDLAARAVNEARALDPGNEQAKTLWNTILQQERMERQRRATGGATPAPATPTAPSTPDGSAAPPPADPTLPPPSPDDASPDVVPADPAPQPPASPVSPGQVERRYLTAVDIQQIRQQELKGSDNVPVQIPADVRRNYASDSGQEFARFNAKRPVEQALEIIQNGDDKMRQQVRIAGDPEALREFKQVQRAILGGCASSQCHGGPAGGSFVLFNETSDPATYTNFYILTQYTKKMAESKGIFGGAAEHKMIERGSGEQSLLAQFSLPPARATLRHPAVKGNYNGIFRDTNDRNYKRLVEWMNQALKPIEPQYKINYKLPGAAREPATQSR
jgi:hypothetical protein